MSSLRRFTAFFVFRTRRKSMKPVDEATLIVEAIHVLPVKE